MGEQRIGVRKKEKPSQALEAENKRFFCLALRWWCGDLSTVMFGIETKGFYRKGSVMWRGKW